MKKTSDSKAQGRTTILLSLFAVLLMVLPGCEDSSSKSGPDIEQNDFILEAEKADDFYVLCTSFDNTKAPTNIVYLFNGSIQNNTDNVYTKGTLRLNTSIELENGTVLTKQEINKNMFGGILSLETFRDFKSKGKIGIPRLESFEIPVEYASYPLKDITIEYSLELEDQIHQTNEMKVLKTVSVIDKWKRAVAKVKANKTDANDGNFPEKVVGQYWREK